MKSARAEAPSEPNTVATSAAFAAGSADESARALRSCVESPITRAASKSSVAGCKAVLAAELGEGRTEPRERLTRR